ncbi:putative porin [Ornithobacterium rhinotracheale]|uniref:putative porin n=1 Tax=Ornithobacterium rhinotracheale TaxID=28251 RepID=UPI003FA42B44
MSYKHFFVFLLILGLGSLSIPAWGQILEDPVSAGAEGEQWRRPGAMDNGFSVPDSMGMEQKDRPSDSLKVFIPTIKDYVFWQINAPKQVMDTALSIQSYYKQNIYNRDLFGYQVGSNLGLALNPLVYNIDQPNQGILPAGKRYLYIKPEDVEYFNVKTPTTHFSFENGLKEGQFLQTLFTHSINANLNYALQFNSLNSKGVFQRQSTDDKNFRVSVNYNTPNHRYQLYTNVMTQKIQSEENGGITPESLVAFKDNDDLFRSRERMSPNLFYSTSRFRSKSFYLNQTYGLFKHRNAQDSTQYIFPIKLKHVLKLESQEYAFKEEQPEEYYKDFALVNANEKDFLDKKKFDILKNYLGAQYQWSERLWIDAGAVFKNQSLKFDHPNGLTDEKYTNNQFGIEGLLKFELSERLKLNGNAEFLQGTSWGTVYNLDANLKFEPLKNYAVVAGARIGSRNPSFNLLANQSFYKKLNFDHFGFSNENYQSIYGKLIFAPLDLEVSAQVSNILNFTYLDQDLNVAQSGNALNYFSVNAKKHQKFGKFHIDAQAQYQMLTANEDKLPLPKILARAAFYYQNDIFQKNAQVMVGTSAYYYSKFKSRAFFPILNEWQLQNREDIGNYPYVDIFANLKVRQMRIYLRGENISSFVLPGKYLYTPKQPAKDFKIQIGINWFLFS